MTFEKQRIKIKEGKIIEKVLFDLTLFSLLGIELGSTISRSFLLLAFSLSPFTFSCDYGTR